AVVNGKQDRQNNLLKNAPHTARQIASDKWGRPYSREQAAFPAPWTREHKFWPAVARIDNVYGDRHLFCSCPPVEEFEKNSYTFLGFARNGRRQPCRFMTRTAIVLLAVALALICVTYLYAHHVWDPLPTGMTIDRIVIEKSARKLSVLANGKTLKTYRVALGRNPVGAKEQEGDNKTPEGTYSIDGRNPQSDFHLALHVSYPPTTIRGELLSRVSQPDSTL